MIQTINHAQGEAALSENPIDAAFEKWWPDLEQQVQNLPPPPKKTEGSAALFAAVKFFLDDIEPHGDGIRWHYRRLVSSRGGFAASVIPLSKSASFKDFLKRAGVSIEVMSFEERKARPHPGPHTGQVLAASNGPILGNGSDPNLHYVLYPNLQLWIDDRVLRELETVHFDFKRTYTEAARDAVSASRPGA
ncbi:MAG: hypothetical protein M3R15_22940 [Acidobacteriota bacterium]|nr:hypothetical protein [Acidobacteriota bacterium]